MIVEGAIVVITCEARNANVRKPTQIALQAESVTINSARASSVRFNDAYNPINDVV